MVYSLQNTDHFKLAKRGLFTSVKMTFYIVQLLLNTGRIECHNFLHQTLTDVKITLKTFEISHENIRCKILAFYINHKNNQYKKVMF